MRALATLALLALSLRAAAAEERELYLPPEEYRVLPLALSCAKLKHVQAITEAGKSARGLETARRQARQLVAPEAHGKKPRCRLMWFSEIKPGTKLSLVRVYDSIEFSPMVLGSAAIFKMSRKGQLTMYLLVERPQVAGRSI